MRDFQLMSLSDSGQNLIIMACPAGRGGTCSNFTVMLIEGLVKAAGEHVVGAL